MQTKYSSPLLPGDDVVTWLKIELPRWEVDRTDAGNYKAWSPTYDDDGITVLGTSPEELVERVRILERAFAILAGRGGSLPVGGTLFGEDLKDVVQQRLQDIPAMADPNLPPGTLVAVSADKSGKALSRGVLDVAPVVSKQERVETAKSLGYTGNSCAFCQSLAMVRNGTCEKCENCGSTSGCS